LEDDGFLGARGGVGPSFCEGLKPCLLCVSSSLPLPLIFFFSEEPPPPRAHPGRMMGVTESTVMAESGVVWPQNFVGHFSV